MEPKNEVWKDVEGYEGLYQVSNIGRVKSLSRYAYNTPTKKQFVKECIRKQVDIKGYARVVFCVNGDKVNMPVHRLVANAFIENLECKPVVNHKNGIKKDNNFENLEWVTASENSIHSYKNDLSKTKGENHHSSKLKEIDVINILKLHRNGIKQTEIAKKYNVSPSPINAIIKGKKWKHITL